MPPHTPDVRIWKRRKKTGDEALCEYLDAFKLYHAMNIQLKYQLPNTIGWLMVNSWSTTVIYILH